MENHCRLYRCSTHHISYLHLLFSSISRIFSSIEFNSDSLAGIIFVLGVALLLSAFSSLISGWVGALLDQVISILNLCIKFINELPFSVADGLHISPLECLLLYGCLIFGIMAIEMKKLRILYAAAVGLLAFILLDLYEDVKLSQSRSICFYSAGWNNLALDCISNNEHVFVCNGPLCQNTKQLDFHVRNYWDALDLKKETVVEQQENISIDANSFSKVDGFIQFRDKLIYLQYDQVRYQKLNLMFCMSMIFGIIIIIVIGFARNMSSLEVTFLRYSQLS